MFQILILVIKCNCFEVIFFMFLKINFNQILNPLFASLSVSLAL